MDLPRSTSRKRLITRFCVRQLVSHRKSLAQTVFLVCLAAVIGAFLMIYLDNTLNSDTLLHTSLLGDKHNMGVHGDTNKFSNLHPIIQNNHIPIKNNNISAIKNSFVRSRIDAKHIVANHNSKDDAIHKTSKEKTLNTNNHISTLVQISKLSNITKPWFELFPKDEHIMSFISFFNKRNTTITTLPNEYTLDSSISCSEGETKLLILVPSVVEDAKIRLDVRKTWASLCYDSHRHQTDIAKIVFMFGDSALNKEDNEELKKESREFGDIVTINMADSYKNLSLKISSMLLWSKTKCPSAKFIAKVDVDTWINIPLMIRFLEELDVFKKNNSIEASTIGFRHAFDRPHAVHSGRWEIPVSIYPYDFLPRYIYGHSYVLSRQAVDSIVTSLSFFPIVPNEDAFITGIMSLVSRVTRVHSPAFAHLFRKQSYNDVVSNKFVSSIHRKNNLLSIWNQIIHRNGTVDDIR